MVTKKIIAGKILSYFHHEITLEQLVSWAEDSLATNNYEKDANHIVRNSLAILGLSDVKSFGLDWITCEDIMMQLGYKLEVNALEVA